MANRIIVHTESGKNKIDKNVYGHFAEHLGRCIYDGFWVGEDSDIPNIRGMRTDIIEALKRIKAPVIRWPGGCFADEYHWKDGIGPRSERKGMVNSHWGGMVENNHFGTHEFFDFCEQVGAEPYVCGNVGSGTVHEMQEWIEYMNSADTAPMPELRRKNGQKSRSELNTLESGTRTGAAADVCVLSIMPICTAATRPLSGTMVNMRFTE